MYKRKNDQREKLTSILSKDPVLLFDNSSNYNDADLSNNGDVEWIEDIKLMVSNKTYPQPGKYKITITYSLIIAPN